MKEFVEKYMCPSLNIHLASYCKGRKKPCVRCDSLDTERKTWSFTKCIPNKQLIYDKRGVTDIREVCHKGKYNFCHILFIKYVTYYMWLRFFKIWNHSRKIKLKDQTGLNVASFIIIIYFEMADFKLFFQIRHFFNFDDFCLRNA